LHAADYDTTHGDAVLKTRCARREQAPVVISGVVSAMVYFTVERCLNDNYGPGSKSNTENARIAFGSESRIDSVTGEITVRVNANPAFSRSRMHSYVLTCFFVTKIYQCAEIEHGKSNADSTGFKCADRIQQFGR
jgi:hypothetical protein